MKKAGQLIIFIMAAFSIVAAYMVVLGIGYNQGYDITLQRQNQYWLAQSTSDYVGAINAERSGAGVPILIEDERLTAAATQKACDMQDRGYFDHKDPDGREAWHLFTENGFHYVHAGENIAKDFSHVEWSMDALMQSPAHRANILSPRFTHVGVGVCGDYMAQFFGKL